MLEYKQLLIKRYSSTAD